MSLCVYQSDMSPWWTFERQDAALADVLALKPKVFRDVRPRRSRANHTPARLVDRDTMLRLTGRQTQGETIHVASLAVLATTEADLRAVLAAMRARGSLLVSADDGPFTDPVAAWAASRTKSRLEGAALRGGAVTKRNMEAIYGARFALIADRWSDPAWETYVLRLIACDDDWRPMSLNTCNKYAGGITREKAIAKDKARRERAQRKEKSHAR